MVAEFVIDKIFFMRVISGFDERQDFVCDGDDTISAGSSLHAANHVLFVKVYVSCQNIKHLGGRMPV